MMKVLATLLSLLVLSLVGCASPIPVAENFPLSYQKVARTAQHWDVVAQDVIAQTSGFLASSQALQRRGVFVSTTQRNTAFDAIFRDFLINHLVSGGAQVSVCSAPGGAGFSSSPDVQIKYETRIIGHAALPHYRPGMLTALASGVLVVRGLAHTDLSYDARGIAGVGAAALADLAISNVTLATRTEIIVTTTIAENNVFAMRRSDIYYVPDGDANLFVQRVAQSSLCPPGKDAAKTAEHDYDKLDDEQYRRERMIKEMRRINPEWRAPARASYSY